MQPYLDSGDIFAALAVDSGFVPDDPEFERMLEFLHPRQREFAAFKGRRRCARAGRRAGKSFAVAYWLSQSWKVRPGQISLFTARTIGHARDILWEVLKDMCRRWEWGDVDKMFNESRSECTFPNGYQIRLRGCENIKQAEKMRGPHYWRVAIDEAHTYPDQLLRHLIIKVIQPALADLSGELSLSGTPGYDLTGYWFEKSLDPELFPKEAEACNYAQWPTFHWDMRDNPHIPDAIGEMEAIKDENGWDDSNPDFVREWLGQWVKNATEKVYSYYDPMTCTYLDDDGQFDPLLWAPGTEGLRSVIGCDVGWEDGCGFAVVQKRYDSPIIRVVRSWSECELDDHAIARHLKSLMREFKTRWVYIDSKGNKITAMTMQSYGIPAEPAVGGEKRPRIEYVRALHNTGRLKAHAHKCVDLIGEWTSLPWGYTKKTADDIVTMVKAGHREGWVDEAADATMNAVLMFSQKYQDRLVEPPKRGTPEWEEAQALKERERAMNSGRDKAQPRHGKRRKSRGRPV